MRHFIITSIYLFLQLSVLVSCNSSNKECNGELCNYSDADLLTQDSGKIDTSTLRVLNIGVMNRPKAHSNILDIVVSIQPHPKTQYVKTEICKYDGSNCHNISSAQTSFYIESAALPHTSLLIKAAACVLPEYASSSKHCGEFSQINHTIPQGSIDDKLRQLTISNLLLASELAAFDQTTKDHIKKFAQSVEKCFKKNKDFANQEKIKSFLNIGIHLAGSFITPSSDATQSISPTTKTIKDLQDIEKSISSKDEEDYAILQILKKYQTYKKIHEVIKGSKDFFDMANTKNLIGTGLDFAAPMPTGSAIKFIGDIANAIMDLASNRVLLPCNHRHAILKQVDSTFQNVLERVRKDGCHYETQINERRTTLTLDTLDTPMCDYNSRKK